MKKLVYVTIALVALFAANSCKNKNNVPIISAADSVEVEDAMNDSTIYGVCGEGTSMHSLELIRCLLTMRILMLFREVCWLATVLLLSVIRQRMER